MPQLDTSEWEINARSRQPIVIDGEALDVTPSMEDDTVAEAPFLVDAARDREPTLGEAVSPFGYIPHGPMKALRPEEIHGAAQLMRQLSGTIPRNEFDLPEYVYRVDLLDVAWIRDGMLALRIQGSATTTTVSPAQGRGPKAEDIQAHLDNAIMRLEYFEGFPTTPDGAPLWERLSFETQVDYDMFQGYLSLGSDRTLGSLIAYQATEVVNAFHCYFWDIRVRAFELFRVARAARKKIERILDMDDDHYRKADKLLKKVSSVLDSYTAEEIKEVGFDKLVKTLGDLTKIQRVAVGLPAQGPAPAEEALRAPTTNIIMQQIAAQQPERQEVLEDDNIAMLEGNTELLEMAQDFILKSQKAKPIND